MEFNPAVLEEVEKALYEARWVKAYGKEPVLATDAVLAQVVVETVFKYLYKEINEEDDAT